MNRSKTRRNSRSRAWSRHAMLAAMLLGADVAWSAPAMKVTEIQVDQSPSEVAKGVEILYAQEKKKKTIELKKGTDLEPGTEISTPAKTEITLSSTNGNVIKVLAFAHYKFIVASAKGENHEVLLGKIWTQVTKQLSFYSVGSRGIAAAAKRTEYTVDVGAKDVTVNVIKGDVENTRPEKIAVGGKEFDGYKELKTLSANERLTVERKPQVRRFPTFQEARAKLEGQAAQAKKSGDSRAEAESRYNLARLTYDAKRNRAGALEAAQRFRDGLNLPISQQDPRWEVLFRKGVGGSLFRAGDFPEAFRQHGEARKVLERELDPTLKSYLAGDLLQAIGNDCLALGHPDQARDAFEGALGGVQDAFDDDQDEIEVGRIYFSLGVANKRLGDETQAHEYFEKSLKIVQELDPGDPMIAKINRQVRGDGADDHDDYVGFDDVSDGVNDAANAPKSGGKEAPADGDDEAAPADDDDRPASGAKEAPAHGDDEAAPADDDDRPASGAKEAPAHGDDEAAPADDDDRPASGAKEAPAHGDDEAAPADDDDRPASGAKEAPAHGDDEAAPADDDTEAHGGEDD